MSRAGCRIVVNCFVLIGAGAVAHAQSQNDVYVGALLGVSTLSADGRSIVAPSEARVSLYKPENGPALNVFGGVDLSRFVTIQGNYIWNRNDVTLFSSLLSASGGVFYEQGRESDQHAVVGDVLLYFRERGNRVRPYLSTGVGFVRFKSAEAVRTVERGAQAPDEDIVAARAVLRVAVGIDLSLGRRWALRYSFSESIGGNPISARLTPPGKRNLANFQNLFGFVRRL